MHTLLTIPSLLQFANSSYAGSQGAHLRGLFTRLYRLLLHCQLCQFIVRRTKRGLTESRPQKVNVQEFEGLGVDVKVLPILITHSTEPHSQLPCLPFLFTFIYLFCVRWMQMQRLEDNIQESISPSRSRFHKYLYLTEPSFRPPSLLS